MSALPRLLSFNDLRNLGIVKHREGLRQLQLRHQFPRGFLLSDNRRVFSEDEVSTWLDQRRAASSAASGGASENGGETPGT